jgi:hypothetical protein
MTSRFSQGLKTLGIDEPKKVLARAEPKAVPQNATTLPIKTVPPPNLDPSGYTAPSRRGKKAITGYYDPAVRQQLAVLAAEEDRSQNDLLAEALNMLFERHKKSPIAKG